METEWEPVQKFVWILFIQGNFLLRQWVIKSIKQLLSLDEKINTASVGDSGEELEGYSNQLTPRILKFYFLCSPIVSSLIKCGRGGNLGKLIFICLRSRRRAIKAVKDLEHHIHLPPSFPTYPSFFIKITFSVDTKERKGSSALRSWHSNKTNLSLCKKPCKSVSTSTTGHEDF